MGLDTKTPDEASGQVLVKSRNGWGSRRYLNDGRSHPIGL